MNGRHAIATLLLAVAVLAPAGGIVLAADSEGSTPERRAADYLAVEVPKWHRENGCFSCHNNGDATRALLAAWKAGVVKDRSPLDGTLAFLRAPERWDANGPDGPFKDKQLARVQFAAALTDAVAIGAIADRAPLSPAVRLVAESQTADGSWTSDTSGMVGSPVTYGRALTTLMAMRTLRNDPARYRRQLAAAEHWFEVTKVQSVLDASVTLWALASDAGPDAAAQRKACMQLIRAGQSDDGGWGPFANAPPEVFDTALALLGLAAQRDRAERAAMIERGRAFLRKRQEPDGSWPATTRPSGVDSYAQRVSTTAWALQALLATRSADKK